MCSLVFLSLHYTYFSHDVNSRALYGQRLINCKSVISFLFLGRKLKYKRPESALF